MIHDTAKISPFSLDLPPTRLSKKRIAYALKAYYLQASRRKRIKRVECKKKKEKESSCGEFPAREIHRWTIPPRHEEVQDTHRASCHKLGKSVSGTSMTKATPFVRREEEERSKKMRVTFLSPRPPRDSIFHPLAAGNRSLRSKLSLKFTLFHLRVSLLSVNVYIGIVATIESLDGKC